MKIVRYARPVISKEKTLRLLGQGRGGRPSRRLLGRVEDLIGQACNIIRPRVIYTTRDMEKAQRDCLTVEGDITFKSRKLSRTLGKCNRVTIFLATIGGKIDELVSTLMRQKKVSDAYIYDAIGSAAVEETVERFQQRLDALVKQESETTSLRFSPGYCDWQIQEQEKIFQVVESDLVGVRLSRGCLMTPRKSVSGVFGIGETEEVEKLANPCTLCGRHDCIARRTEDAEKVHA
jgi:hypothetical protein